MDLKALLKPGWWRRRFQANLIFRVNALCRFPIQDRCVSANDYVYREIVWENVDRAFYIDVDWLMRLRVQQRVDER